MVTFSDHHGSGAAMPERPGRPACGYRRGSPEHAPQMRELATPPSFVLHCGAGRTMDITAVWSPSTLVDDGGVRRRLLKLAHRRPAEGWPRAFVLADVSGSELDTEPCPATIRREIWHFGFWVPEHASGAGEFILRAESGSWWG